MLCGGNTMLSVILGSFPNLQVCFVVQEILQTLFLPRLARATIRSVFQHPAAVGGNVFQIGFPAVQSEGLAIQLASYLAGFRPEGSDEITALIAECSDAFRFRQKLVIRRDNIFTTE